MSTIQKRSSRLVRAHRMRAASSKKAARAMTTTRVTRFLPVVALAAAAGAAIAAGVLSLRSPERAQTGTPVTAMFGGPFTLTTVEGKPFSSEMLKGRPYALFFGFTNCPDVCPTTLLEMSNDLAALGPDANRISVLFITVDPERDTAEHLKAYLTAFDQAIIGLTGSPAQIASVARAYRVFYEKVPSSSGYTMNHTATVFLIDRNGALAGTTNHQEPEAVQRDKLRRLVAR